MKVTNNKILQNWILILVIMMLGFSLVGIYILYSGNKLTKNATESFYNYNLEEKKEQTRTEVSNRLDEINFEKKALLDTEKEILYNKIHHLQLHFNISSVYQNLKPSEVKYWAVNEFEKAVSEDKDYLYFVINTEGIMMRSGTDENIVGANLYNSIDNEGHYFIQDIISAKDNPDGLYVDYYWPKEKGGQPKKKTSYCLYIPEFDFIIGTGIYHEDIQIKLKNKIFNRLQVYYENKENYIFVTDYDSTVRVSANPELVGKKLENSLSADRKSIHESLMSVLEDNNDGFASYEYYKKNGKDLIEKIAYVHRLEDWNAYIGSGFYIDDLQDEVKNYSIIFKKHYYNQTLYIILGLLLLSFVIYAIFQRGAYMQKVMLRQGDIIYEKLFELSNDAIVVVSDDNIILYENEIATKFFNNDTQTQLNNDLKNFVIVNEKTYLYLNTNNRKYYIQIRKEHVSYNGNESSIFFIDDITKQYLQSNALEQMAFLDELTGLQNRRALKEFYEDIYDELDNNNYILGMLDIDKFKIVNDTYGHLVGDKVLKFLSETFKSRLRQKDSIYRYGGEEFILLLNNISLKNAKNLLERIDKTFCELIETELKFKCTFSCGLVNITQLNRDESLDNLILITDELLYKAKENGRNRVEI